MSYLSICMPVFSNCSAEAVWYGWYARSFDKNISLFLNKGLMFVYKRFEVRWYPTALQVSKFVRGEKMFENHFSVFDAVGDSHCKRLRV